MYLNEDASAEIDDLIELYAREYEAMTEEVVKKRLSPMYADKTDGIYQTFRAAHAKEKPFDIYSRIVCDPVRQAAVNQAERKAAQNAAPAYLYWFTWKTRGLT